MILIWQYQNILTGSLKLILFNCSYTHDEVLVGTDYVFRRMSVSYSVAQSRCSMSLLCWIGGMMGWRKGLNDIPNPQWFHFIILYTYIHDVLYVIYNLLKHAFKNRFEEHGAPRSVCYCTGLEFLLPSHRGLLRVYLRAWIWKIQLQLPDPAPQTALQNYAELLWFGKNRCKRQNKYRRNLGNGS